MREPSRDTASCDTSRTRGDGRTENSGSGAEARTSPVDVSTRTDQIGLRPGTGSPCHPCARQDTHRRSRSVCADRGARTVEHRFRRSVPAPDRQSSGHQERSACSRPARPAGPWLGTRSVAVLSRRTANTEVANAPLVNRTTLPSGERSSRRTRPGARASSRPAPEPPIGRSTTADPCGTRKREESGDHSGVIEACGTLSRPGWLGSSNHACAGPATSTCCSSGDSLTDRKPLGRACRADLPALPIEDRHLRQGGLTGPPGDCSGSGYRESRGHASLQ